MRQTPLCDSLLFLKAGNVCQLRPPAVAFELWRKPGTRLFEAWPALACMAYAFPSLSFNICEGCGRSQLLAFESGLICHVVAGRLPSQHTQRMYHGAAWVSSQHTELTSRGASLPTVIFLCMYAVSHFWVLSLHCILGFPNLLPDPVMRSFVAFYLQHGLPNSLCDGALLCICYIDAE